MSPDRIAKIAELLGGESVAARFCVLAPDMTPAIAACR